LERVGWLVVAVLSIVLFFASIPAYYDWLINFADPDLESATMRANLEKVGISVDFYATFLLSIRAASAVVWVVVGVVIFWRRSDDRMALFTSLTLVTFAVFYLYEGGPNALAAQYPALGLPVHLLAFFGSVSFALFFYLFPDGRLVPRWARWVLVLWVAHEAPYHFFPNSIFDTERSFPPFDFVADLSLLGVGIGAQIYRYRRVSGPVQRQQTKWVVFGTVSSVLGLIGLQLLLSSSRTLAQYGSPYTFVLLAGIHGFLLLIPLSIGVAILRNRLWDIDIIINRTLVYGTLTATLGLVYYLGVILLQAPLSGVIDQSSQLAVTASTLAVVALFVPLRRKIQKFIDKRFYRTKYDARKTLEAFGARVRDEADLQKLSEALVEVVDETMKPSHISLWLRPPSKNNKP
jgi:hypothetical protein